MLIALAGRTTSHPYTDARALAAHADLLAGRWCLEGDGDLSPGQHAGIDRIWAAYPHPPDDDFVAARLDEWLC